jgi:hypothetical protein
LLGNARFSVHPLVPAVDQTGAQVLWSSARRDTDSAGLVNADGARQMGGGVRTIAGRGDPGAIAELRVNGAVVSRTRVRLDGTFEFLDVDVPSRGFNQIDVFLLDRVSGTLIERFDYSRRGGSGMLASGQHTLFAALGVEGNPLDELDSRGTAGALQWRYGVNDGLTAEISRQDDGENATTVAAASAALGRHWFGSLAYASGEQADTLELALEGGQGPWRFDLLAREAEVDRPGERQDQWARQLLYRYDVSQRVSLGLSGRDVRTETQDERFLLPTLGWNNGKNFWTTAAPNSNGDYRIDSRLAASARDTVRYTFEDDDHFLDYRHMSTSGVEYYATYRQGNRFSARYEFGAILRSDSRLLEHAQFGLVYNENGDTGYLVEWDARPLAGIYSRLRVSDNAFVNEVVDLDTGFTVQWDVSVDFAVSAGRVIPADSNRYGFNTAALVGEIAVDFPGLVDAGDIEQVSLIVDGVSHTARVQNGKYFLDGLAPGIRRVALDSRYLPIQLSPEDGQQYWVRLENAAATEVPFRLRVRYSVAGKVSLDSGDPLPDAELSVLDERGRQIRTVYTDQFGLYRVDNLPPGHYRIVLVREERMVAAREVRVRDSFLFEQDLLLSGDSELPDA